MRRFFGMLLIFLVLGLTASSAMAASNVAPRSTPSVPQTSGCPCCSGKVNLPKDIKVQELRGPVAYFWALGVLGLEDTMKLHRKLVHFGLVPDFQRAQVQVISSSKGTVKIIKIPLKGTQPAVLVYVQNKLGSAVVVAVEKNTSVVEYYYKDGKLQEVVKPIPQPQWHIPGKCTICLAVAWEICDIGYTKVAQWGCGWLCGIECLPFDEDPITGALCTGACYVICKKILSNLRVKRVTCAAGAYAICSAIGACKG